LAELLAIPRRQKLWSVLSTVATQRLRSGARSVAVRKELP
jgi:hypothetical protein